jgi:hypothetical protein
VITTWQLGINRGRLGAISEESYGRPSRRDAHSFLGPALSDTCQKETGYTNRTPNRTVWARPLRAPFHPPGGHLFTVRDSSFLKLLGASLSSRVPEAGEITRDAPVLAPLHAKVRLTVPLSIVLVPHVALGRHLWDIGVALPEAAPWGSS